MRVLSNVTATPEQLTIISRTSAGIEIIRGAAGSGKTTTAILRLRGLTGLYLNRRVSQQSDEPVKALILTYNRTLKGYVDQLAEEQGVISRQVDLRVDTFAHWAYEKLGKPAIAKDPERRTKIIELGKSIPLDPDFLFDEIDYIKGLYLPETRNDYLTAKREGRGASPRIDRTLRQRILDEVLAPYEQWKTKNHLLDWNDLEVALALSNPTSPFDILIADETQDFSANQIRAILKHCSPESAVTFILDSAQRIYARGFSWADVGVRIPTGSYHRLQNNYRNTIQIASFVSPLVEGITLGDADATIPNLDRCNRTGDLPKIIVGRFNKQLAYAISYIKEHVNLENESVAFLHAAGWFKTTKEGLTSAGLPFVSLTRQSEWPTGPENIALSTIHSAKGLEFDHVFLIGLSEENLQHGTDPNDDQWTKLRRLLAMGITRAKKSVILGYKSEDRSDLMEFFKEDTYSEIHL